MKRSFLLVALGCVVFLWGCSGSGKPENNQAHPKPSQTAPSAPAKPTSLTPQDNNALHEAVALGNKELVEKLLSEGADVNAKNDLGNTPLHVAVTSGQLEIVKILLAKGADTNSQNLAGETPYEKAKELGNKEIIACLSSNGADATPFDLLEAGDLDKLTQILNGAPETAKIKDDKGRTLLHVAAKTGDRSAAELLSIKGIDIDAQENGTGLTAIMVATINGHPDLASFLAEQGAGLDIKSATGQTVLFSAAKAGSLDWAQALLSRGADANAKDNEGSTPLHVASENGQLEIAQLLVEKNADVKAANAQGVTPLGLAIKNGHTALAELLRSKGAFEGTAPEDTPSTQDGATEADQSANKAVKDKVYQVYEGIRTLSRAVEDYRRKNEIYPDALQKLTEPPVSLPGIPKDPFAPTDAPMDYRTDGKDLWVFRSVGPDGKPDVNIDEILKGDLEMGAGAKSYDPTNGTVSAGDIVRLGP